MRYTHAYISLTHKSNMLYLFVNTQVLKINRRYCILKKNQMHSGWWGLPNALIDLIHIDYIPTMIFFCCTPHPFLIPQYIARNSNAIQPFGVYSNVDLSVKHILKIASSPYDILKIASIYVIC